MTRIIKTLITGGSFKVNLLYSYMSDFLIVFFGFVYVFLINLYFGIDVYGKLVIVTSLIGAFNSFIFLRTSDNMIRFFVREKLNNNYCNAKFVLFIGFFTDIFFAVILILFFYFSSEYLSLFFFKDTYYSNSIFLYSISFAFSFTCGSMLGYFQSNNMFFYINTIKVIEVFSKLLLLLILIFISKDNTLESIVFTIIFSTFLSLILTVFLFFKKFYIEFNKICLVFNKSILIEYLGFTKKMFFLNLIKGINQNIDNLILSYFVSPVGVGLYQVIKKILQPINIVVGSLPMLTYSRFIIAFEHSQISEAIRQVRKINFFVILFGVTYITFCYGFLANIFYIMKVEVNKDTYNVYMLISGIVLMSSFFWWTKSFSSVVNLAYSIYANIFVLIFQLVISVISAYFFNFFGFLYSLISMNICLFLFWHVVVKKYV